MAVVLLKRTAIGELVDPLRSSQLRVVTAGGADAKRV
jgi:hypothetical protein